MIMLEIGDMVIIRNDLEAINNNMQSGYSPEINHNMKALEGKFCKITDKYTSANKKYMVYRIDADDGRWSWVEDFFKKFVPEASSSEELINLISGETV